MTYDSLTEHEHERLVHEVTAMSTHGPLALRQLWEDLVARYGLETTSRLWQEGLASSDIGQT